jgi:F0F1-type ATP synthase membrane subunit b/b'
MKKLIFILLIVMTSSIVFAAGGPSGHVPIGTVISQMANLTLLIAIIFFATRKTIAQALADKKASFLENVDAASKSKKEAQDKLNEVIERLTEIKNTFKEQVSEAKKNAEESYRIQIADARNSAEKLKSMTHTTLEFEIQKQVENIRIETFQKSADRAEKNMTQNLTPEQMKAWNARFAQEGAH